MTLPIPLTLPQNLNGSTITALSALPDATEAPALLTNDEIKFATRTDAIGKRQGELYDLYSDYYLGRQRDPRQMSFTADGDLTRDRTFAARHNVCAPIIDVFVERLTVRAFGVTTFEGEDTDATRDIATSLWRWWQIQRLDALARIVHRRAFIFGDAYVMLDWDYGRGRARCYLEDPRQIVPVYDQQQQLVALYKAWVIDVPSENGAGTLRTRMRINRYRAGLIEKFIGDPNGLAGTFKIWDGDGDGGIIPWLAPDKTPLPIPFVHFRNTDLGDAFGRSELDDTVPMQDELNRRIWATGQAAVYDGARIKYGINVTPFVDEATGMPKAPPLGPNVFWYLSAQDNDKPAEVATLDTGDLGQLQEVVDRELKMIAGLLGIPLHLIWPAGGLPSGESLKVAESRLVAKMTDRTITFGNSWEDLAVLVLRLGGAFADGDTSVADAVQLTTAWESVETRAQLTEEQVLALKAEDLSWEQRMRERGYDEELIQQIKSEKEAETPKELREVDENADNPLTEVDEEG